MAGNKDKACIILKMECNEQGDIIHNILTNVISIPEKATNGDVIETAFDINEIHAMTATIFVVLKDGTELEFNRKWWDAPYKKTNNDSNNLKDGE